MAKQNLSDEELSKYISMLSDVVQSSDTKDSVMILFGAFIGLVADDYPHKVEQYLSVLGQIMKNKRPTLKLVKK